MRSSSETTERLLQLLLAIVSTQQGSEALVKLDDISPLTETAPSHPATLDIIARAWLTYMFHASDKLQVGKKIDQTIQSLVVSFKGTDAVTLLDFLGIFLRQIDSTVRLYSTRSCLESSLTCTLTGSSSSPQMARGSYWLYPELGCQPTKPRCKSGIHERCRVLASSIST
jgi:hypothetical protein